VTKRNPNTRLWTLVLFATLLAFPLNIQGQTKGRPAVKRQPPANTSDAGFNETVKKADQAREAGDLDAALDLYGKILQMRPKWAEGWWYAGTILYERDRYREARDAFRNLVALEPKRAHAWGMLGLCEYQTREYDRAVNSLQRGRSLGLTDNPEIERVVRYHTALLYNRFEQFEVAFDILSEFVREGRDSPKIIEACGLAMLRMAFLPNEIPPDKREQVLLAGRAGFDMVARRLDEARRAFSELLARYPDSPNVHYAHGVFLLKQDSDAALEEFRRELQISPDHVPSLLQMAFEHHKRNQYETALPLAEKAAKLAPKMFAARNILGRLLLELDQVERAIRELEEGVRLAPQSPEMHYALARAYSRAGRKGDAAREREVFRRLEKQHNNKQGSDGGTDPPTVRP
jgi:tetratricopeptide (TPR) repeat protein